jgi:hypothetical protein
MRDVRSPGDPIPGKHPRTPTFASCHGRPPPDGVQKTPLCVRGRLQAIPVRTAQIGAYFAGSRLPSSPAMTKSSASAE